jgi:endonuclease/exonuclease/phosphatase (EEP) superfamily protein YafD
MLAAAVLVGTILFRPPVGWADWAFVTSQIGVLIWQLTWVGPYLPGTPRAVKSCVDRDSNADEISLLIANVLQKNRCADSFLTIISDADPDLVLAVETDEWWAERLTAGLSSRFVHKISYPLSNGYGLVLFSRLELSQAQVRFVFDEAIPSIRTGVKLRSGAIVRIYGVHPRPPAIEQDSTERDCELLIIASEIEARGEPAVVIGDLNDVAWSPTTLNFMRAGNLLDPRRGRGFYNTYPANLPGLRYPLDYVFNTRHFEICAMRVLPAFGSDHLPLIAKLRLRYRTI